MPLYQCLFVALGPRGQSLTGKKLENTMEIVSRYLTKPEECPKTTEEAHTLFVEGGEGQQPEYLACALVLHDKAIQLAFASPRKTDDEIEELYQDFFLNANVADFSHRSTVRDEMPLGLNPEHYTVQGEHPIERINRLFISVRLVKHLSVRKGGKDYQNFFDGHSDRDNSLKYLAPPWWSQGAKREDDPHSSAAECARVAFQKAEAMGEPYEYKEIQCEAILDESDHFLERHRKVQKYAYRAGRFRTIKPVEGPHYFESLEEYRNYLRKHLGTRDAGVEFRTMWLYRYDCENNLLSDSSYSLLQLGDHPTAVALVNEEEVERLEIRYTLEFLPWEAREIRETHDAPRRHRQFCTDQDVEDNDDDLPREEDEDQDHDLGGSDGTDSSGEEKWEDAPEWVDAPEEPSLVAPLGRSPPVEV